MRLINEIPKGKKKDKVILIGRGPSVDNIDAHQINVQTDHDTCTISDAIKLVNNPTYSFCYHYQSINRMYQHLSKPKYIIMPTNVPERLKLHGRLTFLKLLDELDNDYYFNGRNRKDINIFKRGEFDIVVEDKLFNRYGSVVGAMHFLMGYMGYKKIYYIGFDGGTEYGKLVHTNRKDTKKLGAARDYKNSWDTIPMMMKHYPDVAFEPLNRFLIKNDEK